MRKFIFAFIAMLMLTGISFGQSVQNPTEDEVKDGLATILQNIISQQTVVYKSGMSYVQFKAALYKDNKVPTTLPKEGDDLFKKTYSYIVKGGATKEQLKKDGFEEMAAAIVYAQNFEKAHPGADGGIAVCGGLSPSSFNPAFSSVIGKGPCSWWQIGCWFHQIFAPYDTMILCILLGIGCNTTMP